MTTTTTNVRLLADLVTTATPATFTTEWNWDAVNAALLEQLRTFGTKPKYLFGAVGLLDYYTSNGAVSLVAPSIQNNKYDHKCNALDRTLKLAFQPRRVNASDTLSLDGFTTDQLDELGGADPLDQMADADESRVKLDAMYAKLTDEQRAVAELLIDGHTQMEIARILGINQSSVARRIAGMRKRLA